MYALDEIMTDVD